MLREQLEAARVENARLLQLINTPELHDFAKGTRLEAVHQRERWGTEHDAGKSPEDWFWLVGYLAGKALHHHKEAQRLQQQPIHPGSSDEAALRHAEEKALHHAISTAAALANWHAAITGTSTVMRPGIKPPAALEAA